MALVTTPGAANANSYATVAEFKTYRDSRMPINTTAAAASDSDIEAALIAAARSLDDTFQWTGSAVDEVQALMWPRNGMFSRTGFAIANTVNPQALKDAQCEWAYQLLAGNDTTSDDEAAKKGIASVKAGSVAVSFQSRTRSTAESADIETRLQGDPSLFYLNAPGEVRRLLVPSWYFQKSIKRDLVFKSY